MGSILYNGTSYGGGGDSTVIPNPIGEPTDTLNTIGINNVIYNIEGSGREEGYSETSLWSGSDSTTMQLSESFENYDAIMIIATASTQQGNYRLTNVWSVDYLKNHINDGVRFGLTGDAWYVYFSITNSTTFTRQDQYIMYISEIKGLKISGSSSGTDVEPNPQEEPTDTLSTIRIGNTVFDIAGSSGGSGYSSTLLWDYVTDNAGTIPYGTYSVTLNDAIENYDILIGEIKSTSEDSGVWDNTSQMFIDVNTLINSKNPNRYLYTSYGNRASGWYISGTTMEKIVDSGNNTNGLIRVYGLKFGGSSGSGGSYTETILYNDTANNENITLSDSILNYDQICIISISYEDSTNYRLNRFWSTDFISDYIGTETKFGINGDAWWCNYTFPTASTMHRYNYNKMWLTQVIGIKYSGGGSGTTVVANPTDTPTDTLSTIQIGNDIFKIEGSGGTGGILDEIIFTDTAGTTGTRNITLTKSLNNFDAIYFEWFGTTEESYSYSHMSPVYPIEINENGNVSIICYPTYGNRYVILNGDPTSTSVSLESGTWDTVPLSVYKIHGLKFGGGGSGDSNYTEVSLFTGTSRVTNMTLSESIKNFDAIEFQLAWTYNDLLYHISEIITSENLSADNYFVIGSNNYRYAELLIIDNTHINWTAGSDDIMYMKKIKGIKYGGGSGSSEKDISDMTWTQIISQAGGAWSAATSIPSGTKYLGIAIDHENAVYMPKTLKLSELNKYASMLNYTIVREGIHWKHNDSNDDIYYEYDSANQTIKVYAGWSGLSVKVFAIS